MKDLNYRAWTGRYANGPEAGNGTRHATEVADDLPALVPVRDSKDQHGPALIFSAAAWSSFVADVKGGQPGGR
ncbi:DUF397 domain-containing protein [Streptomyces sp. S186]|uniref:DUF397 domain-containing protein n=1 Tax=Streptomyces sp. S186 TaxID=3434395 RepID=UPI003F680C61